MTSQSQKTSKERIKEASEVLSLYNTQSGKNYILKVMVKQGELTQGEAGKIILDNNL